MKSSAPSDVVHSYTTGLCWELAVAMKELTGLPVWTVFDDDNIEVHAFVFDEDTLTAYDIRGALSISEVLQGPWEDFNCIGKTISLWTSGISTTQHSVAKAKTVAKRYLSEVIGDYNVIN